MTYKRVGGLIFWRVGKLGGSFFWAAPKDKSAEKAARRIKRQRVRRAASMWHRYSYIALRAE